MQLNFDLFEDEDVIYPMTVVNRKSSMYNEQGNNESYVAFELSCCSSEHKRNKHNNLHDLYEFVHDSEYLNNTLCCLVNAVALEKFRPQFVIVIFIVGNRLMLIFARRRDARIML